MLYTCLTNNIILYLAAVVNKKDKDKKGKKQDPKKLSVGKDKERVNLSAIINISLIQLSSLSTKRLPVGLKVSLEKNQGLQVCLCKCISTYTLYKPHTSMHCPIPPCIGIQA